MHCNDVQIGDTMISVMGATGNTGRKITELLLDAGEEVRALGRSPEKLAELGALGAETVAGDARDADHLASAFAGAGAAYTLTAFDPTLPDYHADQDRRGEAIAAAIRESGVRHVVALSAIGGELPGGNGVIARPHPQGRRGPGAHRPPPLPLPPRPLWGVSPRGRDEPAPAGGPPLP